MTDLATSRSYYPITGQFGTPSLAQSSYFSAPFPIIRVGSGTMGNNGALTLTTALATPTTFPFSCYIRLPASAIFSGSAAGIYFAIFSNSTLATVFNNPYVSGAPTIPSPTTPFVTTGPGAYTAETTGLTLHQIVLPGPALSPYGHLRVSAILFNNNSAGTKTPVISLANALGVSGSAAVSLANQTTNLTVSVQRDIWLIGAASGTANPNIVSNLMSQATGSFGQGVSAATAFNTAFDMTQDLVINFRVNLNTDTDYAGWAGVLVEIFP